MNRYRERGCVAIAHHVGDTRAIDVVRLHEPGGNTPMLLLKPNCEYCDKDLPPGATDAMICSYECTFCADCVEHVLHNVCPNCGGGFAPRPIRPASARRDGVSLSHQPASETRAYLKHAREEVAGFVESVRSIPPERR